MPLLDGLEGGRAEVSLPSQPEESITSIALRSRLQVPRSQYVPGRWQECAIIMQAMCLG